MPSRTSSITWKRWTDGWLIIECKQNSCGPKEVLNLSGTIRYILVTV
jgi:hypothetical protein